MSNQWIKIYTYILQLHRADEPNYDLIYSFLYQILNEIGCSHEEPFDWERLSSKKKKKIFRNVKHQDFQKTELNDLPEPVVPDVPPAVSEGDNIELSSSREEPNCLQDCLLI